MNAPAKTELLKLADDLESNFVGFSRRDDCGAYPQILTVPQIDMIVAALRQAASVGAEVAGEAGLRDLLKIARDYIVEDSLYFHPPENLLPRIEAALASPSRSEGVSKGEVQCEEDVWPKWAAAILAKLQEYGFDPVDDDQTVDLAEAFDEWVEDYAHECNREVEKLKGQLAIRDLAQASLTWRRLKDELPPVGKKIIALYSDGSGSVMFFRHDDGYFDCEGGEYPVLSTMFSLWAELPQDFEFWCETRSEDPIALSLPSAQSMAPINIGTYIDDNTEDL